MKNKCIVCGKEFESKTARAKYCCKKCSNHSRFAISLEDKRMVAAVRLQKSLALRNSGKTYKEIAEILGVSTSYVSELFRRSGNTQNHAEKKERDLLIVADRKAGFSMNQCAEKYELTSGAVLHICKKYGVDKNLWEPEREIRHCECCGKEFEVAKSIVKRYCSEECRRADYHSKHDVDRRIRKRDARIDAGITLKKVFNRDNGICQICGLKCNWEDYVVTNGKKRAKKMYPSVDHIVALANGGKHSWENVRLAHMGCNSSKGVKAS